MQLAVTVLHIAKSSMEPLSTSRPLQIALSTVARGLETISTREGMNPARKGIMKKEESRLHHLKQEIKDEALLLKARAEVAAEDVIDTVETRVSSIANAIGGSEEKNPDGWEILASEADKVFRLQNKLLSFVTHLDDSTECCSAEKIDRLETTLHLHLDELQGEHRELTSVISDHETGISDRIASVSGTLGATATKVRNEYQWSTVQEIEKQLQDIASTYQVIHGLAVGSEKSIAAGMAWDHMRKIETHRAELIGAIYHITVSKVCSGKPVEPVIDQAIEEWRQSQESSLKHASRELVETVVD